MRDTNSVCLVGRLTRDIGEGFGYTKAGTAVANFSIAVNRTKKDGENYVEYPVYVDVRLYGRAAENLRQYLLKGTQVCVVGRLDMISWEKDGRRFSKLFLSADHIQLLGGKNTRQDGYSEKTETRGIQSPMDEFPEEIPF